jgi:hypothetical protein
MKNHNALFCFALLLFIILLTSCSVGMALSGKEEMNTSILYPGVPREAVISRMGEPASSNTDEEGNYIDAYTLVKGNEPSSTRAVVHGTLDVFTLGLWELMATPIEVVEGVETKSEIVIYYDSQERIKEIKSTDPQLSGEIELMEVNNDDMHGDLQKDDQSK